MQECNPAQDFEALLTLLTSFGGIQLLKGLGEAALGSFAGAYGAIWVGERWTRQKQILQEVAAINRAFGAVYSCLNSATNLANAIVEPKRIELDELTQKAVLAKSGQVEEIRVEVFQSLKSIEPVQLLEDQVLENVGALQHIAGRPHLLAAELVKAARSLNTVVLSHNNAISQILEISAAPIRLWKITGQQNEDNIDTRYRDSIESLASIAQDVEFFSLSILTDLAEYSKHWKTVSNRSDLKILTVPQKEKLADIVNGNSKYRDWQDIPLHFVDPF